MRAVLQRVSRARVTTADRVTGEIGRGLLVLLGVEAGDSADDVAYVATKVREVRIFEDEQHKMNRSVVDDGGSVLVVSQFTLCGDVRKGRRPSFDAAAPPEAALALYESVVADLRAGGLTVGTGEFGAVMQVELLNDGPVTILVDSRRRF